MKGVGNFGLFAGIAAATLMAPVHFHSAHASMAIERAYEVAPRPSKAPPSPQQREASRGFEVMGSGYYRRRLRIMWDGKNRKPGERAHRRWRKARTAGRR